MTAAASRSGPPNTRQLRRACLRHVTHGQACSYHGAVTAPTQRADLGRPPSTPIVLATINAKYIHASFGLRYLRENLEELRDSSVLCEFTDKQSTRDIAEQILAKQPTIVGLGVYIWNVTQTTSLVRVLKKIRPELVVVVGGPEVSHEPAEQAICALADHVVAGEGELAFRDVCRRYVRAPVPSGPGQAALAAPKTLEKFIHGGQPDLATLTLPYEAYSDEDLAHRVLYVEASRGCPFRCEFCLSSLDQRVRPFPIDTFLAALERLLDRGARQFKFVDRTFNLKAATSATILRFFLERMRPELFVHFEMIPDRLPAELRTLIAQFPAGSLQLEIGVQSLDPDVGARISRRQHQERMRDNFAFLAEHSHAHVHADLIIGLPGEDAAGFASGFNRLHAMGPDEIQVGVLKRLRGTPIVRHTEAFGLRFDPEPPYEVLQTDAIPFAEMQRLKRFAHLWDVVVNRGNFMVTAPLIWRGSDVFSAFAAFTEHVFATHDRVHRIALDRTAELLYGYLVDVVGAAVDDVRAALASDYERTGRKLPRRLRPVETTHRRSSGNRRQQRHAGLGAVASEAPLPQTKR